MTKSVALIRGVGGPTAMKMAELRSALTDAGVAEVSTLQVAGNVVFDPRGRSSGDSAALIRQAMHERFGHDLAVIVRTHDQLVSLTERNPFVGTQSGNWVMTIALERGPDQAAIDALDPTFGMPDRYVVDGTEVFVRHDEGVANSKLLTTWFERTLGVVATSRNANTIAKLVDLTR